MSASKEIFGTTPFDGAMAQRGYALNKMCFSFNNAANRCAFKADEEAYMRAYSLNDEQARAIRTRDVLGLLAAGAMSTISPSSPASSASTCRTSAPPRPA